MGRVVEQSAMSVLLLGSRIARPTSPSQVCAPGPSRPPTGGTALLSAGQLITMDPHSGFSWRWRTRACVIAPGLMLLPFSKHVMQVHVIVSMGSSLIESKRRGRQPAPALASHANPRRPLGAGR